MADPLVFYYRDGCHLCEELAAVLFRGWPGHAAEIEWRNVDANPDWQAAYGASIPVLMLGDEVVCRLRSDPARLAQYFGASLNPV